MLLSDAFTPERLQKILPAVCSFETAQDENGWTPLNPLRGHCAAVSLVAQDLFGGDLMRASLAGTPFAEMGSHYVNRLPSGVIWDFTAPQFGGDYPELEFEPRTRQYVMFDPKTDKPREIVSRYKLLSLRVHWALSGHNPIFQSPSYQECFYAALDSPCKKMRFGSLIVFQERKLVDSSGAWVNSTIPELAHLCEPKCIREAIPSRTESMIGACAHAEERALWAAAKEKADLSECELYVAGFFPDTRPWIKKEVVHTCIRCAVQMHHAGIKRVYVPVVDRWVWMSTEEALKTAIAYTTGNKQPS